MGRRRTSKPVQPKAKQRLDSAFNCLFCMSPKSVEVKMVRTESIAFLKCRICSAAFQSRINYLSEAVDVFSEWVDASQEANMAKETASGSTRKRDAAEAGLDEPEARSKL
mmetsp:Transcript_68185/g.127287  ORF Transcript_68185/g.127287 Transcript_68185/m.127287 type:complete len:110 (-) Transcript_68185:6-335(-)